MLELIWSSRLKRVNFEKLKTSWWDMLYGVPKGQSCNTMDLGNYSGNNLLKNGQRTACRFGGEDNRIVFLS